MNFRSAIQEIFYAGGQTDTHMQTEGRYDFVGAPQGCERVRFTKFQVCDGMSLIQALCPSFLPRRNEKLRERTHIVCI